MQPSCYLSARCVLAEEAKNDPEEPETSRQNDHDDIEHEPEENVSRRHESPDNRNEFEKTTMWFNVIEMFHHGAWRHN